MAGAGARATIVLPKGTQFQIEGVGVTFLHEVDGGIEAECAASNLPALERLVTKAGGALSSKAALADAKDAAGAVESKLDKYQSATNEKIALLSHGVQELLNRIPVPAAAESEPRADKPETAKKK